MRDGPASAVGNSVNKSVVEAKVGATEHIGASVVGGRTGYGYAVIRATALMRIGGLVQTIRPR